MITRRMDGRRAHLGQRDVPTLVLGSSSDDLDRTEQPEKGVEKRKDQQRYRLLEKKEDVKRTPKP
jgi:hypothetical protein